MSIVALTISHGHDRSTPVVPVAVSASRPVVRYTARDQRAELHLSLPDEVLCVLALRASAADR